MKRLPVVLVADRDRRRAGKNIQQFVGNRLGAEGREFRSVRLHPVQAVARQEHDGAVHPAPGFRADDADRFRHTLQLPRRGIAAHHPQRPGRSAQQQLILVRNDCRGQRTNIRPQRQLERHRPAFVPDMLTVIPIGVRSLPAHVDRIIGTREADAVPVYRPEGAVRGNRAFRRRQGFDRPQFGIDLRDARSRDCVDVLLAGDEEPGRRSRSRRCDRAAFDELYHRVRQNAQNGTGPGRAGNADRREV